MRIVVEKIQVVGAGGALSLWQLETRWTSVFRARLTSADVWLTFSVDNYCNFHPTADVNIFRGVRRFKEIKRQASNHPRTLRSFFLCKG